MVNNLVIAISGGVGRVGSVVSKAVLDNGGKVIIGDISEQKGELLAQEFGLDRSLFIKSDITKPDQIKNFIKVGLQKFGHIDAAVHCSYPRSPQWGTRFEDLQPEGLKEDLFNQLGGTILYSQNFIRYFKKQGHGNLIHISSILGIVAPKFEHYEETDMVSPIEYSAIKSGIIAITRYLAKYCKGENIRVNCISPGGILDNQPESFLQKYRKDCISKGMLDASDLTGTLIYLLSDQSQYVNGQNILIDDGWIL